MNRLTYKEEISLEFFPAWSGGRYTLDILVDRGYCWPVEQFLIEMFADREELPTKTEINDILWFERDMIAQRLGYDNWEALETNADPTADDEQETKEIVDALVGQDADDAKDILSRFGEPHFVDEKIDDGDDSGENEYVMMRSYDLNHYYIRIFFGDVDRVIGCVDIENYD